MLLPLSHALNSGPLFLCTHPRRLTRDYNLALLDEFNTTPGIKMIWNCSELGAGYAADGFARGRGVGAVITTLGVGGLSALNACAGCYSEDLVSGAAAPSRGRCKPGCCRRGLQAGPGRISKAR
jgi:hypothetical protein